MRIAPTAQDSLTAAAGGADDSPPSTSCPSSDHSSSSSVDKGPSRGARGASPTPSLGGLSGLPGHGSGPDDAREAAPTSPTISCSNSSSSLSDGAAEEGEGTRRGRREVTVELALPRSGDDGATAGEGGGGRGSSGRNLARELEREKLEQMRGGGREATAEPGPPRSGDAAAAAGGDGGSAAGGRDLARELEREKREQEALVRRVQELTSGGSSSPTRVSQRGGDDAEAGPPPPVESPARTPPRALSPPPIAPKLSSLAPVTPKSGREDGPGERVVPTSETVTPEARPQSLPPLPVVSSSPPSARPPPLSAPAQKFNLRFVSSSPSRSSPSGAGASRSAREARGARAEAPPSPRIATREDPRRVREHFTFDLDPGQGRSPGSTPRRRSDGTPGTGQRGSPTPWHRRTAAAEEASRPARPVGWKEVDDATAMDVDEARRRMTAPRRHSGGTPEVAEPPPLVRARSDHRLDVGGGPDRLPPLHHARSASHPAPFAPVDTAQEEGVAGATKPPRAPAVLPPATPPRHESGGRRTFGGGAGAGRRRPRAHGPPDGGGGPNVASPEGPCETAEESAAALRSTRASGGGGTAPKGRKHRLIPRAPSLHVPWHRGKPSASASRAFAAFDDIEGGGEGGGGAAADSIVGGSGDDRRDSDRSGSQFLTALRHSVASSSDGVRPFGEATLAEPKKRRGSGFVRHLSSPLRRRHAPQTEGRGGGNGGGGAGPPASPRSRSLPRGRATPPRSRSSPRDLIPPTPPVASPHRNAGAGTGDAAAGPSDDRCEQTAPPSSSQSTERLWGERTMLKDGGIVFDERNGGPSVSRDSRRGKTPPPRAGTRRGKHHRRQDSPANIGMPKDLTPPAPPPRRVRKRRLWEDPSFRPVLTGAVIVLLQTSSRSYRRGDFDAAVRGYERAAELIIGQCRGKIVVVGTLVGSLVSSEASEVGSEAVTSPESVPFDQLCDEDGHGPNSHASPKRESDDNTAMAGLAALTSILLQKGNAHYRIGEYDLALGAYDDARGFLTQQQSRGLPLQRSGQGASPRKGASQAKGEVDDERLDGMKGSVGTDFKKDRALLSLASVDECDDEEEGSAPCGNSPRDESPTDPSPPESPNSGGDGKGSVPTTPERPSHEGVVTTPTKTLDAVPPEYNSIRGRILNNEASVRLRRREMRSATTCYAEGLKVKRRALRAISKHGGDCDNDASDELSEGNVRSDGGENDRSVLSVARTLHNIGLLRSLTSNLPKAVSTYKQALSLRVEHCGLSSLSVASTLSNLGDVYYAQRKYDLALRSYNEVLTVRRAALGKRHALVVDTLFNIGLVYKARGPYSRAKAVLGEAVRLRRAELGDAHQDVGSALHLLGVVSTLMGEYENAGTMLNAALKIRRKNGKEEGEGKGNEHLAVLNTRLALGIVSRKRANLDDALETLRDVCLARMGRLGRGHESAAEALQEIGLVHFDRGEYDTAVNLFDEVLRVRTARIGRECMEVAETTNLLASCHYRLGRHAKAVELCQQSLRIVRTESNRDHILYSSALKIMGDVHQDAGEYDAALEAYEDVLRIRKLWHEKSLDCGDAWNNLGNARFRRGEFDRAMEAFKEALKLKKLWLSSDNVSVSTTLNNLGHAYYKKRELDLALAAYKESLQHQIHRLTGSGSEKEHQEDKDKDDFALLLRETQFRITNANGRTEEVKKISDALGNIASTLRNIGLVYQDKNQYEKALNLYTMTLSVRKVQPYPDHNALATTAETVGMLQFKSGDARGAMASFREALYVKKIRQGDDTVDVARTLNNMANVHFSTGELEDAMEMYRKALEIKKIRLGDSSEEVGNTLNNIAHVLFTSGREEECLEAYQEVLRIRKARYGDDSSAVAVTLSNMGDVHLKRSNWHMARICFEQCVRIKTLRRKNHSNRHRTSMANDDAEMIRVMDNLAGVYAKLGEWEKAEEAYSESLRLKNLILSSDRDDPAKKAEVTKTLELLAYVIKKGGKDQLALAIFSQIEALRSPSRRTVPSTTKSILESPDLGQTFDDESPRRENLDSNDSMYSI